MIVGFPFSASRIAVKALIPCLRADPIYLIMVAMINSTDVAPEECLFEISIILIAYPESYP